VSLLVVALLALVFGGIVAWLVRSGVQDQRLLFNLMREELDADRAATLAHLERQAQAAREERAALADRIQNPLGAAASMWPVAEAKKETVEDVDRAWLEGPESATEWDTDLQLVLADSEEER
jgi:hypothetical protein